MTIGAARLCDCVIHRVTRDTNGVLTSYGRSTYTVPPDLRNLVNCKQTLFRTGLVGSLSKLGRDCEVHN